MDLGIKADVLIYLERRTGISLHRQPLAGAEQRLATKFLRKPGHLASHCLAAAGCLLH